MAEVVSKQQTTALFLYTTDTRKRRYKELKKNDKPDGKPVLCLRLGGQLQTLAALSPQDKITY